MAAMAFFVWPSAVLIYPLVLAELVVLLREEYAIRKSGASLLGSVMAFVTSGLMMTCLLLIPIWHLLKAVFKDIDPILRASQPAYSLSVQIQNLLDSFKFSQLLPVSALIGLIWGRGRLIAWMALLVFVYIFGTLLYFNRLIYLLPYAIGLIGGVYQIPFTFMANAKTRRLITNVGLFLLIVWSVSSSMIIRPAIALSQREERDPSILFSLGRDSIGEGPYRVYLGAWEFYFTGRWLGWQMLNEYVDRDQRDLSRLLSKADHAIFRQGVIDDDLASQLSRAGLELQKELTDDRQDQIEMQHQFRLGARAYGPYVLYSRPIASEVQ